MPCDQVITNTVLLEKVADLDMLARAIQAEFGNVIRRNNDRFLFNADGQAVTLDAGRATSRLSPEALGAVVGRIKQAYSREVVQMAAKRFGFAVKKGVDANHFHVVRR